MSHELWKTPNPVIITQAPGNCRRRSLVDKRTFNPHPGWSQAFEWHMYQDISYRLREIHHSYFGKTHDSCCPLFHIYLLNLHHMFDLSKTPAIARLSRCCVVGQGSKSQLNLRFIAITSLLADPFLDRLNSMSVNYPFLGLRFKSFQIQVLFMNKLVINGDLSGKPIGNHYRYLTYACIYIYIIYIYIYSRNLQCFSTSRFNSAFPECVIP